jgi:hypothetical protein
MIAYGTNSMGDANEIYKPQPKMTRIHAKSNKVVNGFVV